MDRMCPRYHCAARTIRVVWKTMFLKSPLCVKTNGITAFLLSDQGKAFIQSARNQSIADTVKDQKYMHDSIQIRGRAG